MSSLSRLLLPALFLVVLVAAVPRPAAAYEERALGDPNAPLTVTEYSSLTCGHCANFHTDVLPRLKQEFIDTGKVYWVFRDYPIGPLAQAGALIGRCLPERSYFTYVNAVFKSQQSWMSAADPLARLAGYARLSGLAPEDLQACMNNEELFNEIATVSEEASAKWGIDGTPAFVIDGTVHNGNQGYDYFARVLNTLLKAKGGAAE
ncbi:DsbA family protein [Roseospirillum parvum]|uniref:Thioredoxin n=1 Tax=Roseospirillum parvum TaxID=83401 RepID=A0A1G8CQ78_9PROT|nr:DsbA family protein [Roseospirillum parvum]SDH47586.1 Thioredoxin [Roseospirillum parvum]